MIPVLFQISNIVVMPFWFLMIFLPMWGWTKRIIQSPFIALPPAILYIVLLSGLIVAGGGGSLASLANPTPENIAALIGTTQGASIAWAHFLAHIDGHEGAVLLSATFHNHTRDAALDMSAGDALRAQGYLHPSRNPERLSTFSIFRLIGQGSKPEVADQPEEKSNLLDLHTFLAHRRAAEGGNSPEPTTGA